jgi:hypothetical protein
MAEMIGKQPFTRRRPAMTRWKLFAAPVPLLLAILLCVGAASGASILTSAYQIVQVVSPADNSGSFPISSMMQVLPNGNLQAIPTPLPDNLVFIVTKISWSFMATESTLSDQVMLNVGPYYRSHVQLSTGFCSVTDGGDPGVPITNLTPTVFVQREGDPDNIPIPGKLHLRLMGYVAIIN